MKILDGKSLSEEILSQIEEKTKGMDVKPRLDIILVGDDYASEKYVSIKQKVAKRVGIETELHHFRKDCTTENVLAKVLELNSDPEVTGFMVQLPLPEQLDRNLILNSIKFYKDVDGLGAFNLGSIFQGEEFMIAATALGVIRLLNEYDISLDEKTATMLGSSPVVGLPLMGLLQNRGATVTLCNKKTPNISEFTRESDIVLSATGNPKLITADWVKEGAVVVDIGFNKDPETGKLCGDVDYDDVASKTSYITPVPGGVGPMTVASLMTNVLKAYQYQLK